MTMSDPHEFNLTGYGVKGRVTTSEAPAGIGGSFQYATLHLDKRVLGCNEDAPVLGTIEITAGRGDIEAILVDALADLRAAEPVDAGYAGRRHGD